LTRRKNLDISALIKLAQVLARFRDLKLQSHTIKSLKALQSPQEKHDHCHYNTIVIDY